MLQKLNEQLENNSLSVKELSSFIDDGLDVNAIVIDEENRTLLHTACIYSNKEIIQCFLDAGADITNLLNGEDLPLHLYLCHNDNLDKEIICQLSDNGKLINRSGLENNSPLLLATSERFGNASADIIHYMLSLGADVNLASDYAFRPLDARIKDAEIVKLLLNAGADVNYDKYFHPHNMMTVNESPVFLRVVEECSLEIVQCFIDAGVDINRTDSYNKTALMCAFSRIDVNEIVKILIDAGASVQAKDENGKTVLMYACANAFSSESIRLLMALNSPNDLASKDSQDNTALHYCASEYGGITSMETFDLLLQAGVDVNARNAQGKTVLFNIVHNWRTPTVSKIIKNLIVAGLDINIVDQTGNNSLLELMSYGRSEKESSALYVRAIKTLLDNSAEVNIINEDAKTPLLLACNSVANTALLRQILERSENISYCDNEGNNALICYIENDPELDFIKILVEEYAFDINQKNSDGMSAWLSCFNPLYEIRTINRQVLDYFIEMGADVFATTNKGQTTLMLAVKSENIEAVQYLRSLSITQDSEDKDGYTAIDYALQNKQSVILNELLKFSCPEAITRYQKLTELEKKHAQVKVNNFPTEDLDDDKGELTVEEQLQHHLYKRSLTDERLQTLLDAGLELEHPLGESENNPLMTACSSAYLEGVKLLINAGAQINEINLDGLTPLQLTVCEAAMPPNTRPWFTAGHFLEVIDFLITAGAELHKQDSDGRTVLHIAATNPLALEFMLQHPLDVNALDKQGRSPLFYAIDSLNEYSLDCCSVLLAKGANINIIDYQGNNILLHMFANCHIDTSHSNSIENAPYHVTKFLIDAGARTDVVNNDSKTLALYAFKTINKVDYLESGSCWTEYGLTIGDTKLLNYLLTKKLNLLSCDQENYNPFMYYLMGEKDISFVKHFIGSGCNINHCSNDGYTPFLMNFILGNCIDLEVLEYMISQGADIFAKTVDGKTALDLAKRSKSEIGIRFLREHEERQK